MSRPLRLDPERFFPADPDVRRIAVQLFASFERLPIVSPHGHTDPAWFASDAPFQYAVGLLLWLDHVFGQVFNLNVRLAADTADLYFDTINDALRTARFRPRALYDSFGIEVLASTEGALDSLQHHRTIAKSGWSGRVITTFRPDDVIDPERADFIANVGLLGELTGEDCAGWDGYLTALRKRRRFFREHGATATDHGHPTAATANLSQRQARGLFARLIARPPHAAEAEL